jgi:hypothetical protein
VDLACKTSPALINHTDSRKGRKQLPVPEKQCRLGGLLLCSSGSTYPYLLSLCVKDLGVQRDCNSGPGAFLLANSWKTLAGFVSTGTSEFMEVYTIQLCK